jgi:hypothetical protein
MAQAKKRRILKSVHFNVGTGGGGGGEAVNNTYNSRTASVLTRMLFQQPKMKTYVLFKQTLQNEAYMTN